MRGDEAAKIRTSIARQEFAEALDSWQTYTRELAGAIGRNALSPEAMAEFQALVEWSRPLLLGMRAQLQEKYRAFSAAAAYTGRCGDSSPALLRVTF